MHETGSPLKKIPRSLLLSRRIGISSWHSPSGKDYCVNWVGLENGLPGQFATVRAQRFARHASPLTTTVYTHPSDQEMWEKVRGLTC